MASIGHLGEVGGGELVSVVVVGWAAGMLLCDALFIEAAGEPVSSFLLRGLVQLVLLHETILHDGGVGISLILPTDSLNLNIARFQWQDHILLINTPCISHDRLRVIQSWDG